LLSASSSGSQSPPPAGMAALARVRMATLVSGGGGSVVIPPAQAPSRRHRSSSVPVSQAEGDHALHKSDKLSATFTGPASSPPVPASTPPYPSATTASSSTTPPTSSPCSQGGSTGSSSSTTVAGSAIHLQGLATPPSVGIALATGSKSPTVPGRPQFVCFAGAVGRGAGGMIPTAHAAYPGLLGPAPGVAQQRVATTMSVTLGHQSHTSLTPHG
jgi:hypothetical protein